MNFIDTHTHLDGEEFDADRDETLQRAKDAGVSKVFIPAIDMPSVSRVLAMCDRYPGYAYPMIGLHPEEVRADWQDVLKEMKPVLDANRDKVKYLLSGIRTQGMSHNMSCRSPPRESRHHHRAGTHRFQLNRLYSLYYFLLSIIIITGYLNIHTV